MRRDELNIDDLPANDRPGDHWMCGRMYDPCAQGPSCAGVCPMAGACRPRRTWTSRRRQFTWSVIAITAVFLVVITRSQLAVPVFQPGELSRPHAQILSGTLASDRCGACHAEASTSPLNWFASGGEAHDDLSQTDRCLNCHHTTIDRSLATSAHNLPQHELSTMTAEVRTVSGRSRSWHDQLPGPAISQSSIQCSVCHREHRGSDSSLVDLSDTQCQTCHADRFGSFATAHPDWNRWPYGRGGVIAFDHRSHATKHFPESQSRGSGEGFDCNSCHQRDQRGEPARSVSYEASCQSCHDASLRVQAGQPIDLVALPSLPPKVAGEISDWPEAATGFADGSLAAVAQLLCQQDRKVADALRILADRRLDQLDLDDPDQLAAMKSIATTQLGLLSEIAQGGQTEVQNVAHGIPTDALNQFLGGLSPQLIADALKRWLENQLSASDVDPQPIQKRDLMEHHDESLLSGDSDGTPLLDSPPLQGDALLSDPLAEEALLSEGDPLAKSDPLAESAMADPNHRTGRFDPSTMLGRGGWYRDDLRLAISYRAGGHADPALQSLMSMIAALPESDPLRAKLLQLPAVAACASCHTPGASGQMVWKCYPLIGRKSEFTKFAHRPHLNVSQLGDCNHCHRIASASDGQTTELNLVSTAVRRREFEPVSRAACATCHQPKAAGDSCVGCHRYHVHAEQHLSRSNSRSGL